MSKTHCFLSNQIVRILSANDKQFIYYTSVRKKLSLDVFLQKKIMQRNCGISENITNF